MRRRHVIWKIEVRSILRYEAFRKIQNVELHAEVDAVTINGAHPEPFKGAYPEFKSRWHPIHNAILSGKFFYRRPGALRSIMIQYEKREEVHLTDANQFASASVSFAPQLRGGRLGRNWVLSGPPAFFRAYHRHKVWDCTRHLNECFFFQMTKIGTYIYR
jgi:hypothetical protein